MFLLCNGLLVFIVKNSGLIGTSPPDSNLNDDEHDEKINGETRQVGAAELTETKAPKAKEDQLINVEIGQEHEEKKRDLITADEECRNGLVIVEDHGEFEGNEGEEGFGSLSAEELNKKCDEFIRRMKEVIKLEVQQSMIMV